MIGPKRKNLSQMCCDHFTIWFFCIVSIAFWVCSCFGTVQSLGSDAEQGVAVEAVGQGQCSMYSEDTVTDEAGRFRLRGLLVRLAVIYLKNC